MQSTCRGSVLIPSLAMLICLSTARSKYTTGTAQLALLWSLKANSHRQSPAQTRQNCLICVARCELDSRQLKTVGGGRFEG